MYSLAHPPIHSFTSSLTDSPTHSLTQSFTHSSTHSLIHYFTHPPTHSPMHSLSHSPTHITITNELTLRTLTQQCTFRQLSPVAPAWVSFRRRLQHAYHSTKVPTAHIYDFITLFFTFPAFSWSLVGNAGHPGYYVVLPDLYFLHASVEQQNWECP